MKMKVAKILSSIFLASAMIGLASCRPVTVSTQGDTPNTVDPSTDPNTKTDEPVLNEPYSDTPSDTWKDLEEPSYKYECWKEYDRYPDWYNPYRPWENEPEDFNYKDIMEYNINNKGDSITWDGTIIPSEKTFKINVEDDDYSFESKSAVAFYTKEQIKSLFDKNKPNNDECYISEIVYEVENGEKIESVTDYFDYRGYSQSDYSVLDINNYISSINKNIIYFEITCSKYSDEEKNIIAFNNEANEYFTQEEISHFDFNSFTLNSNYKDLSYNYMNYNNYINFEKDENTNNNIEGVSNSTQDKSLAIKDFFENNKDKDFIIINNQYNYYEDLYNLFETNANEYEKSYGFYNIVKNINFEDLSLTNYNGDYNSIFAFNLTTVDDNVADLKLDNIGDIKFQAGVTYVLKIENNKIKILKTDRNISKDTFVEFLYNEIMSYAINDVNVTVNNNLNLNLFSNITLDQNSNGNFNDFEDTGIIGQNALGSSTLDMTDRKETLSELIDTLNLTNKTLSFKTEFNYYGYTFRRYYDYTLTKPQIAYNYYYMNYQNYKKDSSKTEYGPAYLKYGITITFDAIHIDSLQQESMIWDTETQSWKTYFEQQDYERYNIKHNADGKFTITIEYNNNPEIAESERLKYSFDLTVDNTKVSDEILNQNKIEKQYIRWSKTNDEERFVLNAGSNVTEYEYNEQTYTNENLDGIDSYTYTSENNYVITSSSTIIVEENSSLVQNNNTPTLYEGTQNNISITTTNNED